MEYVILWNVAMVIGFVIGYKLRPMTKEYQLSAEEELRWKKKNEDIRAIMEYNEGVAVRGERNEG